MLNYNEVVDYLTWLCYDLVTQIKRSSKNTSEVNFLTPLIAVTFENLDTFQDFVVLLSLQTSHVSAYHRMFDAGKAAATIPHTKQSRYYDSMSYISHSKCIV